MNKECIPRTERKINTLQLSGFVIVPSIASARTDVTLSVSHTDTQVHVHVIGGTNITEFKLFALKRHKYYYTGIRSKDTQHNTQCWVVGDHTNTPVSIEMQ
jgi:hypothetical protein